MPRNMQTSRYSLPPGIEGVPGTPISSSKYNMAMRDLETDMNAVRPVEMGGTGVATMPALMEKLDKRDLESLAALKADTTASYPAGTVFFLRKEGYAMQVVASDPHVTTAGGVMLRAVNGDLAAYGADGVNDQPAFARAVAAGGDVRLSAGNYPTDGQLDTASGFSLRAAQGAVIKPRKQSQTGSILTNVTQATSGRAQSGVLLDNIQMDMANYIAPVYFIATGGTTTSVILPSSASSTSEAYTGLILQFMSGALAGQYRFITGYVGSTRTATLNTALATAPASGVSVAIGYNDNATGWAWGLKNIQFNGGLIENVPASKQIPFGQGGKAVNLEQGVQGASGRLPNSRNVGAHFFLQGKSGTIGGVSAAVTGVALHLGHAENAGSFVTVVNLDNIAGISASPDELCAVLTNGTYHNAGHNPWRVVGTDQQKSGIINLGGANGVTISDVRGFNDTTYPGTTPGYPTDYPSRVGYGLAGNVGALIWGHARNSELRHIHHGGDLDCVVRVGRCRAVGDDGGPTGFATQMRGWNMSGIKVAGTVQNIVTRDALLPSSAAEITGYWQIEVESCSGTILPAGWTNGSSLTLDLSEVSSGKRVIGTASQIVKRGNLFAALPDGTTDLRTMDRRTFTLNDDQADGFIPLSPQGLLHITSQSSLLQNIVRYRLDGTAPQIQELLPTAGFATRTGGLGGTTGADDFFTVAAGTNGIIYLENRRGAPITVTVTIPTTGV